MKITKTQLRSIIKEEKQKLLVEMNPTANADRSLGLYADMSTVDNLTDNILNLLQEVMMGAEEDGLEEEDAELYSRQATLLAVARAVESAGMIGVKLALQKLM